jgi:hypothetical protein
MLKKLAAKDNGMKKKAADMVIITERKMALDVQT